MIHPLVIDILDGSGVPIGPGPILSALNAMAVQSIDEVAALSFAVPATDSRARDLVAAGEQFRIRTPTETYTALIRSQAVSPGLNPTMVVSGPDYLSELVNFTSGMWAMYVDEDANSIVLPSLLAGTGWSLGSVDAGLGAYQGVSDGETKLMALQRLRETLGRHFRHGVNPRTLDFGAFGEATAGRLTNVDHARKVISDNAQLGIINTVDVTVDRESVVNLLVPLGGGQDNGDVNRAKAYLGQIAAGNSQWANIFVRPGLRGVQTTTIAGSSGSTIRVASTAGMIPASQFVNQCWMGIPQDVNATYSNFAVGTIVNSTTLTVLGSPNIPPAPPAGYTFITFPQYYIYNAARYAANPREATVTWSDIIAYNTESQDSWSLASIMLYNRALAYLNSHLDPQTIYHVSTITYPAGLRPGNMVRLRYAGPASFDGVPGFYIDIDEDLFVLSVTRQWFPDGSITYAFDVSDVQRLPTDEQSFITDMSTNLTAVQSRA